MVARSVGLHGPTRASSTSSSATSAPAGRWLASRLAPLDLPHVLQRRQASRTEARGDVAGGLDDHAFAPESARIHCDLLGGGGLVDGHGDAPAPQIAKSISVHS